jgi:hypothetical protein
MGNVRDRDVHLCPACGQPVDPDVAHNPHDPNCPARKHLRAVCVCDQWVHPECCWECNPPR